MTLNINWKISDFYYTQNKPALSNRGGKEVRHIGAARLNGTGGEGAVLWFLTNPEDQWPDNYEENGVMNLFFEASQFQAIAALLESGGNHYVKSFTHNLNDVWIEKNS